ncbi:UNVERIFIED_CONTAM: lysine--tRNA ligase, partial [Euhalothece sp. KZN 001]
MGDAHDPYLLQQAHAEGWADRFFAETVADAIVDREPDDPIVIKGGISPSGVAHVGNFNEIIRGWFVAEVLRERGHTVEQVFTSDDRDPLRSLPRQLADVDGGVVGLGEVDAGALGRNLGAPYSAIPDPFGVRPSYAAHFTALIEAEVAQLQIPIRMESTTALYESGAFDPYIAQVLEDVEQVRSVLGRFQDRIDDSYIPFNAVCQACGKITETIEAVDLDARTVTYRCTDLRIGGERMAGCGDTATVPFSAGKLPWRFEWPAEWDLLGVDFEPFGKDHAEGSWPSGVAIAEEIYGTGVPVPMVYEWFTLDGAPMSSSAGTVVTVDELLEMIEPAVFRYFFALSPQRARDLQLERLDQLVDAFDRFEAAYFEPSGDAALDAFAAAAYPHVVETVDPDVIRLPYTFAAVLGMTDDVELRREMARSQGYIDESTDPARIDRAMRRVEHARRWAQRMGNAYDYRLQPELPEVQLEAAVVEALETVATVVDAGADGEAIQTALYDAARAHDAEASSLFAAGYELFFAQPQVLRLGA